MNHFKGEPFNRFFALFIALTLTLPGNALALREIQTKNSGLEEQELTAALKGPAPTVTLTGLEEGEAAPLPAGETVSLQVGQKRRFLFTGPVEISIGGISFLLRESSVPGVLSIVHSVLNIGWRLKPGEALSMSGADSSILDERQGKVGEPGFRHVVTIRSNELITVRLQASPAAREAAPSPFTEETTRALEVEAALSELARVALADGETQLTRIRFSFNPATVGEKSPGYVVMERTELDLPPAHERQTTDWSDYRPSVNQVSSYSTLDPKAVTVRVEGDTIIVEPIPAVPSDLIQAAVPGTGETDSAAGVEERGVVYARMATAMADFRRQGDLEFQSEVPANVGVVADLSGSFEGAVAALYLPAGSTVLVNTSMLLKAEQLTGRTATERGLNLFYVENEKEFSREINRAIGSFQGVEVIRVLSTRLANQVNAAVDVGGRDIRVEVRADLGLDELMANLGAVWTQGLTSFINRVQQSTDYSQFL